MSDDLSRLHCIFYIFPYFGKKPLKITIKWSALVELWNDMDYFGIKDIKMLDKFSQIPLKEIENSKN